MRERFEAEGLEDDLLHRKPKRTKPRKLDGSQEAHLISLACSEPPKGRDRWSVRFLAERFVSFECVSRKRGTEALENKGAPEWEPPNGSPLVAALPSDRFDRLLDLPDHYDPRASRDDL